jgi:hypothetical protein
MIKLGHVLSKALADNGVNLTGAELTNVTEQVEKHVEEQINPPATTEGHLEEKSAEEKSTEDEPAESESESGPDPPRYKKYKRK